MDFFRSILADDPEPETLDNYDESDTDAPPNQSPKHQETEGDEDDDSNSNINSSEDGSGIGGGLWSFGDLVKTLTTKSESVFETYRRDLKEFGTGLRKESDLFREVASRAVKELPSSIEVGTSAIDGVLKSTADFISQGKGSLLAPSGIDDSERHASSDRSRFGSRRYSRFDAQLNAIQSDARTYCEDPEDIDDYNKWKLEFVLGDNKDEIEKLVGENGVLAGIYAKLVPNDVDDGTFWYRYFYKVNKFKLQEDLRAKLVKRSLSADVEEELSWDIDDDDDEEEEEEEELQQQQQQKQKQKQKQQISDQLRSNTSKPQDFHNVEKQMNPNDESKTQSSKIVDENKEMNPDVGNVDKNKLDEPKLDSGSGSLEKTVLKVDLKVDSGKVKDVSKQTSNEEEDLEWDKIEADVDNNAEKKVSEGEISNKGDLRKRLSTAVDDEDLSWDIEDDDDDDNEVVRTGNK